jgi:hypothetical protein
LKSTLIENDFLVRWDGKKFSEAIGFLDFLPGRAVEESCRLRNVITLSDDVGESIVHSKHNVSRRNYSPFDVRPESL